MREILADLAVRDEEHPDVWLTHESTGWTLSAYSGGNVVWQNLDAGGPRHMRDVSCERVFDLWIKLSYGEIEAVEQEPWQPGYY
jgi:hypothetical protein